VNKAERNRRSGFVAAYREGLGLAAVAAISTPSGIRIIAERDGVDPLFAGGEIVQARWWCRRADDAERVAAAASARLGRRKATENAPADASSVAGSIIRAARQLNVALASEEAIVEEAMALAGRIDQEIERLKQVGGLRTINKSYRDYRIETSARGECVMRYQDWMNKYRENLVRQLAETLRYF